MLAKYVVFLFALAAFVNAAPVVDYRPVEVRSPKPAKNQPPPPNGFNQPAQYKPQPAQNGFNQPAQYKPQPAQNGFNQPAQYKPRPGPKRETSLDPDDLLYLVNLLKRASVDADLDDDGGVNIALPPPRRSTTLADTRSYQISDIVFDEIPQGQGKASSDTGEDGPGSKRGLEARFSLKDIIKTFFPLK